MMQDSTTVIAKNVADVLDVLAVRFGSTAEHLWAVLIRQAVAEAWSSAFFAGLWFVTLMATPALFIFWVLRDEKRSVDTDYDGPCAISVFLVALGAILTAICVRGAVLRLVNPEFYALEYVLGKLP